MRIFLCLLFLVISGIVKAEVVSLDSFKTLIAPYGLTYELPPKFKPVEVKTNRDLFYNFAIQRNQKFEIRYSIQSLQPFVEKYEASLKDSNTTVIEPNSLIKASVIVNVLNISGANMADGIPEITYFDQDAVKNEFGADLGGTTVFNFKNTEYGQGFEYGQMVFLHVDNLCDVFIVYLGRLPVKKFTKHMFSAFYSLRFK